MICKLSHINLTVKEFSRSKSSTFLHSTSCLTLHPPSFRSSYSSLFPRNTDPSLISTPSAPLKTDPSLISVLAPQYYHCSHISSRLLHPIFAWFTSALTPSVDSLHLLSTRLWPSKSLLCSCSCCSS